MRRLETCSRLYNADLVFKPHNMEQIALPGYRRALTPILTRLSGATARPVVVLPVWYHPSVAPDLSGSQRKRSASIPLSISTATHTYLPATGFAPGFCYLGTTSTKLAVPRLATPRSEVPAGSVALADQQTAVYPGPSPGGWRVIGSCPLMLFNLKAFPPALLTIGDSVRFEPVSESEFRTLGDSG